jgi:transglutaminase-like putative cysteine protease
MTFALLLIPTFSLWWHSGHHVAALLALAGVAWLRRQSQPRPLRRLFLYVAVVPFALWWFLAPPSESRHGVPLLLFYIPGWYFLFLAWAQAATLGRGGKKVFFGWNAGAALLVSGMEPSPVFYGAAAIFASLLLYDFRRERTPERLPVAALALMMVIAFLLAAGGNWMRQQVRGDSDFLRSQQMRGFSPVSFLGSFAEEYTSPYENQVVLRVYAQEAPAYLRGAVYADYRRGHWRLEEKARWLRPSGQKVEFSVFGGSPAGAGAWIYPSVTTFGFLLVPQGTGAVAVQADSLGVADGGALLAERSSLQRGWFAWPGSALEEPMPKEHWLVVPDRLQALMKKVRILSGMDSAGTTAEALLHLISWFSHEFTYSATPPSPGREEPLEVFVQSREGYCEYFATLATLALRAQGVPARYVTGFSGPDAGGDGVWLFRRRHAHAWVEYYAQGQWRLLDPTPPGAMPTGERSGWFGQWKERLGARLTLLLHYVRDGDWKLALDRVQVRVQEVVTTPWLYGLLAAIALGVMLARRVRSWRAQQQLPDWRSQEWARKLRHAERALARRGQVRERGETVGCFLARLGKYEHTGAAQILRQYQAERFRAGTTTLAGAAITNSKLQPPGAPPV